MMKWSEFVDEVNLRLKEINIDDPEISYIDCHMPEKLQIEVYLDIAHGLEITI